MGQFNEALKYAFDYDFWVRLLCDGRRPTVTSQVLSAFRLHRDSKTCAQGDRFFPEDMKLVEEYRRRLRLLERLVLWFRLDRHWYQTWLARVSESRPGSLRALIQSVRYPTSFFTTAGMGT